MNKGKLQQKRNQNFIALKIVNYWDLKRLESDTRLFFFKSEFLYIYKIKLFEYIRYIYSNYRSVNSIAKDNNSL